MRRQIGDRRIDAALIVSATGSTDRPLVASGAGQALSEATTIPVPRWRGTSAGRDLLPRRAARPDPPRPDHDETTAAGWFPPAAIDTVRMHPAVRRRLVDALGQPQRTHFD